MKWQMFYFLIKDFLSKWPVGQKVCQCKVLEYDVSTSLSLVESQFSSLEKFGGGGETESYFSNFTVKFQSHRSLFETETKWREK